MTDSTINILAVIEATTVNGPAKNLLRFCRGARSLNGLSITGMPRIETSIVTFDRAQGRGAQKEAGRGGGSLHAEDETSNEFITAARAHGVEVDVIHERFRFDARVIGQLRSIVDRRAPDIIQTHMIKSHFLFKITGLWRRHPWVAYHHGYTTTDLKMRFYNQLNRWSLPSATRVITVCGPFAERLIREGVAPEKIIVQHNSVTPPPTSDEAELAALRHGLDIAPAERVILAVGRLSREKGHVDLISAFDKLRRLDPDLKSKLVIVGGGPERSRIEEAIRNCDLDERVTLAGEVTEVQQFYGLADVLVLPSHSEGSPNVLLEAMAAGIPVVATAVGGVPEIATNDETALLVPPRDPEAMARGLHRLLTDAPFSSKLAERARTHVLTNFSPDVFVRSLARIYRELALGRVNSERLQPVSS